MKVTKILFYGTSEEQWVVHWISFLFSVHWILLLLINQSRSNWSVVMVYTTNTSACIDTVINYKESETDKETCILHLSVQFSFSTKILSRIQMQCKCNGLIMFLFLNSSTKSSSVMAWPHFIFAQRLTSSMVAFR